MADIPPPAHPAQHKTAMDDVVSGGAFVRKEAKFRNFISREPGAQYPPEANRYRLYVSLACPWACRTLMVRALKGLTDVIDVVVVRYVMGKNGWEFAVEGQQAEEPCRPEPHGFKRIRELYVRAVRGEENLGETRFSVPVLWDTKTETIVNNESSEIIVMLNDEMNAFAKNPSLDLYPASLRAEMASLNDFIYHNINNGVYKCGFARAQGPYEEAYHALFDAMDKVEGILSRSRFLLSNEQVTLADIRLFTTLVRFDVVYYFHFKCNKKMVRDYPNLADFLRDVYQMSGVRETVNLKHIKHHYYESHPTINPFGIVPVGPEGVQEWLDTPVDRARKFA